MTKKEDPRKNTLRKILLVSGGLKSRWLRFLRPSVVLGLLATIYFVEIPVTQTFLDMAGHRFPKEIKVREITISVQGRMELHGISLGRKNGIRIGHISLYLNWSELFKGRICLRQAVVDSVIGGKRANDLLVSSSLKPHLSGLFTLGPWLTESSTLNIKFLKWVCKDSIPPIKVYDIVTGLGGLDPKYTSLDIQINKAILKSFPAFLHMEMLLGISSKQGKITNFKGQWARGNVALNAKWRWNKLNKVKGKLAFKNIDLSLFSKKEIFERARFSGLAKGNISFQGFPTKNDKFIGNGSVVVHKVKARGLPFQDDFVIKNYMPDLKAASFNSLRISHLRIRGQKIVLDSVHGFGKPLSFSGSGRVVWGEHVFFKMNCQLTKSYYNQLSQLAKDAIGKDKGGRPVFQCTISGDMENQSIYLEKMVSRVIKTKVKRVYNKIMGIFKK